MALRKSAYHTENRDATIFLDGVACDVAGRLRASSTGDTVVALALARSIEPPSALHRVSSVRPLQFFRLLVDFLFTIRLGPW
jgi:hypothetical protein